MLLTLARIYLAFWSCVRYMYYMEAIWSASFINENGEPSAGIWYARFQTKNGKSIDSGYDAEDLLPQDLAQKSSGIDHKYTPIFSRFPNILRDMVCILVSYLATEVDHFEQLDSNHTTKRYLPLIRQLWLHAESESDIGQAVWLPFSTFRRIRSRGRMKFNILFLAIIPRTFFSNETIGSTTGSTKATRTRFLQLQERHFVGSQSLLVVPSLRPNMITRRRITMTSSNVFKLFLVSCYLGAVSLLDAFVQRSLFVGSFLCHCCKMAVGYPLLRWGIPFYSSFWTLT